MSSPMLVDISKLDTAGAVNAATKSINDMDASRRVGWAKMYAAIAAAEKAERELAIAREDLALLSKFAGFTFGALQSFGLYDIYQKYLNGDTSKLTSYFPDGAMKQGREVAKAWGNDWIHRLADKTAYYEARAKAKEANEMQFAAAKRKVTDELAEQYGFADENALHAFLSQHDSGTK